MILMQKSNWVCHFHRNCTLFVPGDNEEDWFKAILAEAASSSDSDNDDDEDEDSAKSGDSGDENKANGNSNDEEDEFNPFFYDFAKGDPYIRRAKADNGKKKKKMVGLEQLQ